MQIRISVVTAALLLAACVHATDSRYGTYWALVLGEPQPE